MLGKFRDFEVSAQGVENSFFISSLRGSEIIEFGSRSDFSSHVVISPALAVPSPYEQLLREGSQNASPWNLCSSFAACSAHTPCHCIKRDVINLSALLARFGGTVDAFAAEGTLD